LNARPRSRIDGESRQPIQAAAIEHGTGATRQLRPKKPRRLFRCGAERPGRNANAAPFIDEDDSGQLVA
jgi:hypothetical protein